MKLVIEDGKEFKALLNIAEKCISDMSGGPLSVKCVQLVCSPDESNAQGKGQLEFRSYKEGLCSFVGVMDSVLVYKGGSVFIDKQTIGELLELLGVIEGSNALITLDKPEGKDLEIKVKDYGSRKLGVITHDDGGEEVQFPISGLNSSGKTWKDIFKDPNGKLIDKFLKLSSHVGKQDEFIEVRIEELMEGANHYEVSLNVRLMEGNVLKYITHVQMKEEEYESFVYKSFRIPTRLKEVLPLFKNGFTFSITGEKEQIYRMSNSKGDVLTFFPYNTLVSPSAQIDACIKEADPFFCIDVELNRLSTALKFHMTEKSGGDAELSINNDYLNVRGDKSSSPASIQLHSKDSYGEGWKDLVINVKPLISGGQPVLNLLASSSNVTMSIVPYKKNNKDISPHYRVIVIKPYVEFEGGSPTLLVSGAVNESSGDKVEED